MLWNLDYDQYCSKEFCYEFDCPREGMRNGKKPWNYISPNVPVNKLYNVSLLFFDMILWCECGFKKVKKSSSTITVNLIVTFTIIWGLEW